MAIDRLDDGDIALWIANFREPNPVFESPKLYQRTIVKPRTELPIVTDLLPNQAGKGYRIVKMPSLGGHWMGTFSLEGALQKREPIDVVGDPLMRMILLDVMKLADMHITIDSDPDYKTEADIDKHRDIINEHDDWGLSLWWGDSNCHHKKNYDPVDGHGYTSFSLIGRLNRIIPEAFMLANGWRETL